MARMLIVDDEIYAIEGIKAAVDWASLGVGELFTAFNASQAREELGRESVDIVLCDIEMPEESGLDLLSWMRSRGLDSEVIFLTCHEDFKYAREAIRLRSFDYLVKPVDPAELREAVAKALGRAQGSGATSPPAVAALSGAAARSVPAQGAAALEPPDMSLWSILLKSGAVEKVRYELKSFLARSSPRRRDEAVFLKAFLLDFQQVLLAALKARSVPAHGLLGDPAEAELYAKAADSSEALARWADHALDFFERESASADRASSPFGEAARYIAKHLGEELSCDLIAEQVGLNPDYLTRLFKREAGLAVSAYIARERVRFASELLATTTLPVGEVADAVGYGNPAYFAALFKRTMGKSPVEYRLSCLPPAAVRIEGKAQEP